MLPTGSTRRNRTPSAIKRLPLRSAARSFTELSAALAALNSVNDLAADLNGNLFIADGVRLRRVDPGGNIVTVAGDGYVHSVGDGGPATMAQLYQPSAPTLDSAGSLFIADSGTERVRQVIRDGTMTTLAGTGAAARG